MVFSTVIAFFPMASLDLLREESPLILLSALESAVSLMGSLIIELSMLLISFSFPVLFLLLSISF